MSGGAGHRDRDSDVRQRTVGVRVPAFFQPVGIATELVLKWTPDVCGVSLEARNFILSPLVCEHEARGIDPCKQSAAGELLGGLSGWTWQEAAGIGLTWVREDQRGAGLGADLLARFEHEASERGARRVFVTSFTFQAPGFYGRHGYREIFRCDGVPVDGQADVHFRKDLD